MCGWNKCLRKVVVKTRQAKQTLVVVTILLVGVYVHCGSHEAVELRLTQPCTGTEDDLSTLSFALSPNASFHSCRDQRLWRSCLRPMQRTTYSDQSTCLSSVCHRSPANRVFLSFFVTTVTNNFFFVSLGSFLSSVGAGRTCRLSASLSQPFFAWS